MQVILDKGEILVFMNFDHIDCMHKDNLEDDSGVIVMNSGLRLEIASGFNELFAKIKRSALVPSIL